MDYTKRLLRLSTRVFATMGEPVGRLVKTRSPSMLEVSTHRATGAVRVPKPPLCRGWSELMLALPEFVLTDAFI